MCFFETSWKTCLVMCPAPSRTEQGWTTAQCHRSNTLFKYFLRENSSHSPSINSLFCSLTIAYTLPHWSAGRSLSTAKLADSHNPWFITQTFQSYAEIFTQIKPWYWNLARHQVKMFSLPLLGLFVCFVALPFLYDKQVFFLLNMYILSESMERPTSLILATNNRLNVIPYIFLFLKCLIITTQRVRFMSHGFWFILSKTVRVLTHYRTLTSNCWLVSSLPKSHPNKTKLYPLVLSVYYIQRFKRKKMQSRGMPRGARLNYSFLKPR